MPNIFKLLVSQKNKWRILTNSKKFVKENQIIIVIETLKDVLERKFWESDDKVALYWIEEK